MADLTPAEKTRDRLHKKLVEGRRPDINKLYAYYRGEHPLPWAPAKIRDAYRALLMMSRSNWCRLVVEAPAERLRVVGMRFSDTDGTGDVEAWKRHWQGNRLDLESRMVHRSALVARRGFVLVWPSSVPGAPPMITPEHPAQVIVDYQPGNRRVRTAGYKTFVDVDGGMQYATLWLPDVVYQWKATWKQSGGTGTPQWEPWTDEALNVAAEAPNPVGQVPIIEFIADPDLIDEPMGELDGGVTDIQDRINKTILDRLVTSNFSSFRQKWATGLEIPVDDNGNDIEPFDLAVNRLLTSEDPNVKFGEFAEATLDGYIKSVESDIQHLAAITRTPPHYLLGQSGAFPSGESLKATETGLVAKVLERRDSFTESWEDVIRLSLSIDEDSRADDDALEMVWKDPESRTTAEVMDAAVKQASIGVPFEAIMEFIGKSPTEIARLVSMRADDIADGMFGSVIAASQPKGEKSIAPGEPGGLGSAPVGAPAPAGTAPLPPV